MVSVTSFLWLVVAGGCLFFPLSVIPDEGLDMEREREREGEFAVFFLTFCLLLALSLTGIGRVMAVSIWKQGQGRED